MTRPPIDELEALVAQATLPWHVGCTGEYVWCGPDSSDLVADCINDEQDMSGNCARAALIVAAVNALPALLVYVRALESLAEARGRAVDAANSALKLALRFIEERADCSGYGFYRPANPHDFSPDHESCSPDEIAAHKAACEAFDRGEFSPPLGSETYRDDAGNMVLHILRAPWGIGAYSETDPDAIPIIKAARAALAAIPASAQGRDTE